MEKEENSTLALQYPGGEVYKRMEIYRQIPAFQLTLFSRIVQPQPPCPILRIREQTIYHGSLTKYGYLTHRGHLVRMKRKIGSL